jgi:hypothetical protein
VYSLALRTSGLIHFIMYNVPSSNSLFVSYVALILSKLEYASFIWNRFISADSNKIENIPRKFAGLCCYSVS